MMANVGDFSRVIWFKFVDGKRIKCPEKEAEFYFHPTKGHIRTAH